MRTRYGCSLADPKQDASNWLVALRWRPFDRGTDAFPPLAALPVEFQVSYFVLSERPCGAAHLPSGPSYVEGFVADEQMLEQRKVAKVCLEAQAFGWP